MKKLLSIAFCLAMLITLPATAFASDMPTNNVNVRQASINEYEALKALSKESVAVLSEKGFSSAEISKIQNYKQTYSEHIMSLQGLPTDVLAKHGYSPKQISAIKNFNGSEAQMSLAAASLDIYSTITNFKYKAGDRTTGRLAYGWEWTGVPSFELCDMVAASWNSWHLTGQNSSIGYFNINTGEHYDSDSADFVTPKNSEWNGAGHRFTVGKSDNHYYAKSGSGFFTIESDGLYQKDFYYYIEYGHATFSSNIGFSVSVPGGAAGSISFSVTTAYAGSDSGSYRW